jgi:hypothetical protein
MLTFTDERKGLVKTNWQTVRKRVEKVAPEFAKIINALAPDNSFPLYLAYYPYGDLKGDTVSPLFPKVNGGNYRLSDVGAPKDVILHLGYGTQSSPLGMLLEKKLEYYIDLNKLDVTIPLQVLSPGSFFPLARILQDKTGRTYTPNGLLTVVSGARSAFMLPKIGCATNHLMLKRHFNVQSYPPKSLYEHWQLFKDIVNSNGVDSDWRSCVLYFSKKWVDKIHNDSAWYPVKKFLLELAWKNFEYERNHLFYNIAYSLIQSERNLKPNPYLTDTACHLFTIALGAVPGYSPSCDNESLPLEVLQKAFVEGYGLKKYVPTIIQPTHFTFENKLSKPIYYSLQYPSMLNFSPKSRKLSSTLFEMRELKYIVNIFQSELVKDSNIFSDTVISDIAKSVDFNFFHSQTDVHSLIEDSNDIIKCDNRFAAKNTKASAKDAVFSCDAPFVRGCISIKPK